MNAPDLFSSDWAISFRSGWWLWALLGLTFLVLALRSYRQTTPALPRSRRLLLLGLRLTALAMLSLALIDPKLKRRSVEQRPPRVTLLVDQSSSISRGPAAEQIVSLLKSPQLRRVFSSAAVSEWGFADTVWDLRGQEMSFQGASTAIGDAILSQRKTFPPPDAVILVTDGANTSGSEPLRAAREAALPLFIIGVGDSAPPRDVRIVNVAAPPSAVAGRELAVAVTLENTMDGNARSVLHLMEGKTELARTPVMLAQAGARTDVELPFTPGGAPGPHRYTVVLDPVPGESNPGNNARVFPLDVLKSRKRVTIITGSPSADIGYWIRFFAQRMDFATNVWYASSFPGRPSSSPPDSLSDTDLFLWLDPPPSALPEAALQELIGSLERGSGLLVVSGANGLPADLQRVLPADLRAARLLARQTEVSLGPSLAAHPVANGDPTYPDWSSWETVPPLPGYVSGMRPREDASVLMTAGDEPLAVAGQYRLGRVLVFGGAGYWRWDLLPVGMGVQDPAGPAFWKAAVRWIASREASQPVRIQLGQSAFRLGEPVRVDVFVSDERSRPVEDASVLLSVDASTDAVRAETTAPGRYTAHIRGLLPSDYVVRAEAQTERGTTGFADAAFVVDSTSAEDDVANLQVEVLKQLAAEHPDSRFVTFEQSDSMLASLSFSPLDETREQSTSFGSTWWLLCGLVVFLGSEWALRRAHGLL